MLATMIVMVFPLLSNILPSMSTSGSPLLLPMLLLIVLALSLSTSYLQSAVFALAALWGPKETLAVMSGQGGVACIVSLAQVFLAMAESKNAGIPENGHGSTKAAQALWFIGAIGTIACIAALRYLVSHPDYVIVLAPLAQREVSVDVTSKDMTKRVFAKNITLEFAVAFVFTVTLVSSCDASAADHRLSSLPSQRRSCPRAATRHGFCSLPSSSRFTSSSSTVGTGN